MPSIVFVVDSFALCSTERITGGGGIRARSPGDSGALCVIRGSQPDVPQGWKSYTALKPRSQRCPCFLSIDVIWPRRGSFRLLGEIRGRWVPLASNTLPAGTGGHEAPARTGCQSEDPTRSSSPPAHAQYKESKISHATGGGRSEIQTSPCMIACT